MKRYALFAAALLLDLVGAAGALLVASQHWQTITWRRTAPLPDVTREVSGRTIDAGPTALALVALAGVVAVLATRGLVRRIIGVVVALAGLGLIWRSLMSADAVSASRAREIVGAPYFDIGFPPPFTQVETHALWPVLTVVCGALVAVAGALIAWRGHRWQVMSARYETPPTQESDPAKTAATLWTKLDRGEDPTD
jgi:uncharacterized membrane protein (TIGR02234 family)